MPEEKQELLPNTLNGKPFNDQLRLALKEYRDATKLTNRVLGLKLGMSAATISLYLAGKYNGDIPKLESKVQDFLRNDPKRKRNQSSLFDNSVSGQVAGACEFIRKTNHVGIILGRAGIGKSCGTELYCEKNPTAILLTAMIYRRNVGEMERFFFDQVDQSDYDRRVKRAEWLVHRFADSDRLIIVDNAHYLTQNSLTWFFNFNDETKCPVALVGNPEILEHIARDEQLFSRVGAVKEITIGPEEARKIAGKQVSLLLPEVDEDSIALAEVVGEHPGRFRMVAKHAILAREIRESNACITWKEAFRSANRNLLSEIKL